MRHILEHNYRWPEILDNALASFAERMVLILFTPVGDRTREIAFNASWGVPDISFKMSDITDRFGPDIRWQVKTFETNTQYSTETVFFFVSRADKHRRCRRALGVALQKEAPRGSRVTGPRAGPKAHSDLWRSLRVSIPWPDQRSSIAGLLLCCRGVWCGMHGV